MFPHLWYMVKVCQTLFSHNSTISDSLSISLPTLALASSVIAGNPTTSLVIHFRHCKIAPPPTTTACNTFSHSTISQLMLHLLPLLLIDPAREQALCGRLKWLESFMAGCGHLERAHPPSPLSWIGRGIQRRKRREN